MSSMSSMYMDKVPDCKLQAKSPSLTLPTVTLIPSPTNHIVARIHTKLRDSKT